MMKYELAKQLKDAGFPQEDTADGEAVFRAMGGDKGKEPVHYPELPELIEACKEIICIGENDNFMFQVYKDRVHVTMGHRLLIQTAGDAETAVANLLLALKEKSRG